jgi:HAD superfamily hydrolase (TIGR01549 family)
MPPLKSADIQAIVFDLDGTLYVCDEFAATIKHEAAVYMARVLALSISEAANRMGEVRSRLAGSGDTEPTLSNVCSALGGSISEMHAHFEKQLNPESYLLRDNRVIELLQSLQKNIALYIYTNNNRVLSTRIIDYLGLSGLFRQVFTIEDNWRPKPDQARLEEIIRLSGCRPQEILFVGDRYDVDLRLPEQLGCPVFLSQNIEQLLRLSILVSGTTAISDKP